MAATLIAQAGHSVALFEKKSFPRFQVGESLVPAVNLTLERMGLIDKMDGRGVAKHGVQFYTAESPSRPFYFADTDDPRLHSTWQVLRSDFDQFLIDYAAENGVDVATETPVFGTLEDEGVVCGVRLADEDVSAQVVLDASGQKGIVAQRYGEREHIKGLENAAVYAHYRDVKVDPGIDAGNTIVFRIDSSAWFWFIPLPDDVVSIGLVAPAKRVSSFGKTPTDILDRAIKMQPFLEERLVEAKRQGDVRVARDFSYRATKDGGPGWGLVGDALGFIDPVYSTGLFLTAHSAELAADAVIDAFKRGEEHPDLAEYSVDYQVAFDRFLALVRAFYQDGFHFGQLAKEEQYRRGLIDLLIGAVYTPRRWRRPM